MLNQGYKKKVVEFTINYRHFLDEEGVISSDRPDFAKNKEEVLKLYENMVLTRMFDAKAIALQRTGKLGTYASNLGQEAIGVGIGSAMRTDDVFCPYYRDNGAQLIRGVTMDEILLYWGGDERGSDYQNANAREDFPVCVPIASQTLHAVGVASAFRIRKEKRAVVVTIGDGGTSRGDFYEAINLAGTWHLPVVFVINSNGWAISVPRHVQTASETIAQKAIAAGIYAEQVDGNDVVVVKDAVQVALDKAYSNKGPSVIEALTYRMCDHTTADDATRYRSSEELESHKKYEPILRLKKYLITEFGFDDSMQQDIEARISKQIEASVEKYKNTKVKEPESMFEFLFEKMPESLYEQYNEVKALKAK